MLQDMGLALESAELVRTALPLGRFAERVYREVVEKDPELARRDFSSVYKYLERLS